MEEDRSGEAGVGDCGVVGSFKLKIVLTGGGHASAERRRYDFAVPGARRDTDLISNGGHVELATIFPSSSCF